MSIFKTTSELKSLAITSLMFLLMIAFICLYKFQSKPIQEINNSGEIAIRFGQKLEGSDSKSDNIKNQTAVIKDEIIEPVISTTNDNKRETNVSNPPVVNQNKKQTVNVTNVDVTKKHKKSKKPNNSNKKKKKTVKKTATVNTSQSTKEKKPSQTTNNVLNNLISGKNKTASNTMGNGTKTGNQGSKSGSLYSNNYYGSGKGNGIGNGSSWGLNGRKINGYNTFKPKCNETGVVVIKVTVNPQGEVINSKMSLSGTTNSDPCLVQAALKTARSFKWKTAVNAPKKQIGFVKINFNLGK